MRESTSFVDKFHRVGRRKKSSYLSYISSENTALGKRKEKVRPEGIPWAGLAKGHTNLFTPSDLLAWSMRDDLLSSLIRTFFGGFIVVLPRRLHR